MDKDVYIVGVKSIFPKLYNAIDITEKIYNEKFCSTKVNKLAKRLTNTTQIKSKAISIDLDQFPKKIVSEENNPLNWGTDLMNHFLKNITNNEVGFISVSYNTSSHKDLLPNLSFQIANASQLNLQVPPQEIVNYGCASGIFSILSAFDFCKNHDSAAYIMAFEQASWNAHPIYDENNTNFKASLKGHTIFGDGSAGLLLASGETANQFDKRLKILDVLVDFQFGDAIKSENGIFLVGNGVKDLMPALVSEKVIKPLLQKYGLSPQDVLEWSLHQGGIPVIEHFQEKDILGLNETQIEASKEMFIQYGNVSAPSNLIVLESILNQNKAQTGDYGMIVGFGAGYYLGAVLYQHC
jgi:predicted naringenin-chalcone synthase